MWHQTHYVLEAGPELPSLLLLSLVCWDCMHILTSTLGHVVPAVVDGWRRETYLLQVLPLPPESSSCVATVTLEKQAML